MPKITIISLNKEIFCSNQDQSVLEAFHDNFIDWMHACGAKGRCTTCSMIILEGIENLSNPTTRELFYKNQSLLKENERLACQCFLSGDIKISVPAASRLPHLNYID